MDTYRSKILCLVIPLIIRNTLFVPVEFSQKFKEYSEERILQCFRQTTVETKEAFFKSCFKTDTQLKNYPYLVDASDYNEETQNVITRMSYFLGMDTDKYITKPLVVEIL